ncbi:MAG: cation:proton antiporter [Phycisphaerae bacterium]|jgi:Kef-type K+ transport system membrane component KefB
MYNLPTILAVDSAGYLDLLFLLGVAIFSGTIVGRVSQKLRIPQVVGYVIAGIIAGGSVLNLIRADLISSLLPFNMFALGIIGFMIGGELKYETFRKYGKQFITILLAEGLFAFFIVSVLTFLVGILLTGNLRASLAMGIVLGAISSATAPAATVDVLWEYKTRGILTRTILAIVALDDGLALLLYGFASSIAGGLLEGGECNFVQSLIFPLWEIFGGIALGAAAGLLIIFLLKYIVEPARVLSMSIAVILAVMGLSAILKVEPILAAMVFGATLVNFRPRRSQPIFKLIEKFSPPVYVLFFVLVGARLQFSNVPFWMIAMAVVYVLGRTIGKMSGSWFGAYISHSPETVRKYLGMCLFSQAGVAIGLSIIASERFGGDFGEAIILIITSTTFLVQIIGPPCVKIGVKKAGEVGLNVTEEDLIETYRVADVMNTKVPIIFAGDSLSRVVGTVSNSRDFYYPVVDNQQNLIGIITLDGVRNSFATQQLNDWLVALDVMESVVGGVTPETPLSEAFEKARQLDIEYLPVVTSDQQDKFAGVFNCREIRRQLSTEVLSRQQKADNISNE